MGAGAELLHSRWQAVQGKVCLLWHPFWQHRCIFSTEVSVLAGPALAGIAGHYWLSRAKLAVKSQGVALLTEPDFWMVFFFNGLLALLFSSLTFLAFLTISTLNSLMENSQCMHLIDNFFCSDWQLVIMNPAAIFS